MNYVWNWLIAYSFQNGLIDREEFVSLWKTAQSLAEMRKCLSGGEAM